MTDTLAGLLQVGVLVVALAVCHRPLGGYLAQVFEHVYLDVGLATHNTIPIDFPDNVVTANW